MDDGHGRLPSSLRWRRFPLERASANMLKLSFEHYISIYSGASTFIASQASNSRESPFATTLEINFGAEDAKARPADPRSKIFFPARVCAIPHLANRPGEIEPRGRWVARLKHTPAISTAMSAGGPTLTNGDVRSEGKYWGVTGRGARRYEPSFEAPQPCQAIRPLKPILQEVGHLTLASPVFTG